MLLIVAVVVLRLGARFLLSCDPRGMHLVGLNLLLAGDSRVSVGVVTELTAVARSPFQRDLLSTNPS